MLYSCTHVAPLGVKGLTAQHSEPYRKMGRMHNAFYPFYNFSLVEIEILDY